MNLKKASLLALAGIAIAGQSAKADTTNYTDGDLLLTFRQAGNSYDYLVDLGQASALPSSGSTTFSIGSIATDLSSIFGSNWYTSTGSSKVYIGIIGSDATNGNVAGPDCCYLCGHRQSIAWGIPEDIGHPWN